MVKKTLISIVVVLVCVCGMQAPVSAASNYALDMQDPVTAGFTTSSASDAVRGWHFQANISGIYVTELGIFSPVSDTTPITVTLFDFATQSILAQVTTTPGAGWRFEDLATPVALTQGSEYIVTGYFSGTQYYFGKRSSVGESWFPTGDIEYLDMRYDTLVSPTDFPTQVLYDWQYGIPDIGYEILSAVTVPAPAAVVLAGLGATAVTWLRRRRAI